VLRAFHVHTPACARLLEPGHTSLWSALSELRLPSQKETIRCRSVLLANRHHAPSEGLAPNHLWCTDCEGEFMLGIKRTRVTACGLQRSRTRCLRIAGDPALVSPGLPVASVRASACQSELAECGAGRFGPTVRQEPRALFAFESRPARTIALSEGHTSDASI